MSRSPSLWTSTDRLLGLPVTVCLVIASVAHAGGTTSMWLQPASGAFGDRTRWSNGVPTPRGTASFGATASTSPFDVMVDAAYQVDALVVDNQFPRFIAGADGAALTLIGGLNISAALPMVPAVVMDGVDLDSGLLTTIAVGPKGGTLTVTNLDWVARSLQLGNDGGLGSLAIGPSTHAVVAEPLDTWLVGMAGTGALGITAGSTLALQGATLRVGGNTNGSGSLSVSPGGSIDLGGGFLYIGGTNAFGSSQLGIGSANMFGSIDGPGTVIIGYRSSASVTVQPGGSLGGSDRVVRVGDGPSGSGTLNLFASHALGTLSIGNVANGAVWVIGAGVHVDVASLEVANGGSSSITVTEGATLAASSMAIGTRGGFLTALNSTFHCDAITFATNQNFSAKFNAIGRPGLIELPPVNLTTSPGKSAELMADGGRIGAGGVSSANSSWIALTTKNGGLLEIDGPLTLAGTSNKNRVDVGPLGALTADSIETGAACGWTWTLPLEANSVSAGSASISGKVLVNTAIGWTPFAPTDLRLLASAQADFAPTTVTTPTFFGFPALLAKDEAGLLLRITDHIDGFALPGALAIPFGETLTLPTVVTLDGIAYDVSDQATWTFAPTNVVVRTGPRTLVAVGEGDAIATVTYGAASTTVALSVEDTNTLNAQLVSGHGLVYGDADSGWDGPGLFVNPFGFGPRSMSTDGTVVAFSSLATNLAGSAAANSDDAFVADLHDGSIIEASSTLGGVELKSISAPALSGDGRFVAFIGTSTVSGTGTQRAVVVDRTTLLPEIVSLDLTGAPASAVSTERVAISDDGRFVAFTSAATNLVEGDTNGVNDVFVRDRTLGTTIRASLSPSGSQFIGACTLADMSADGRFVVFLRALQGWKLAYRFDRLTGQVDLASPGLFDDTPSIKVLSAQITADGANVLFTAEVSEPLVAGPLPVGAQLYRCDIAAGEVSAVTLAANGDWFTAPIEGFGTTRNGRFVVVSTKATNALPDGGPGNGKTQLYRLDRLNGAAIRVSEGDEGLYNDDVYGAVAISEDGRRVAFVTGASNVLPLDLLGKNDVFVRTLTQSPADLDGDGTVQASDLAILLGAWGSASVADLDGDGTVGATDLAILLGAWTS